MKRRLKRLMRAFAGPPQQSERRIGDQARERGDWSTAAQHYQRHVSRNPSDFDIWVQLGHALKETGRYDEAEKSYAQAGEIRPEDADLLLMRGHLAKLRGDAPAAATFYAMSFRSDGNPFAAAEINTPHPAASTVPERPELASTTGVVEGVFDGVLRGWALNGQDKNSPAALEIVLDDEVIARSSADHFRPDLAARTPSNRVGFAVDLFGLIDLSQAPLVHVRFAASGEDLTGSPVTAGLSDRISAWTARHDDLPSKEIERLKVRMATETHGANITFVLPWDQTRHGSTMETATSLRSQWCPHWRLVIAADYTLTSDAASALASQDERISIVTTGTKTTREFALGATDAAQTDLLTVISPGLILEPEAVFRILDAGRSADVVYGDEARFALAPSSVHRIVARPGYCPLLTSVFDFGSLVAVRRERLENAPTLAGASWSDDVRAACQMADGIAHIPAILCRIAEYDAASIAARLGATPGVNLESARGGRSAKARRPRTLILLQAAARTDILRNAVEAILTTAPPHEADLLIIDGAEQDTVRGRYIAELATLGIATEIPDPQTGLDEFLVARVINRRDRYDYVAFIGEGVKPATNGWIGALHDALRSDQAGIASGVTIDPWGEQAEIGLTLTSTGEIVSVLAASHSDQDMRALSASRSSFMMMPTELFIRLGGFDPELQGRQRDADLCLRAAINGMTILSTTSAVAQQQIAPTAHEPRDATPGTLFLNRWRRHLVNGDFNAATEFEPKNWQAPVRLAQIRTPNRNAHDLARLIPPSVHRLQEDARP